jgi:hypothetical protein
VSDATKHNASTTTQCSEHKTHYGVRLHGAQCVLNDSVLREEPIRHDLTRVSSVGNVDIAGCSVVSGGQPWLQRHKALRSEARKHQWAGLHSGSVGARERSEEQVNVVLLFFNKLPHNVNVSGSGSVLHWAQLWQCIVRPRRR